jgi:hypothetical protein
MREDFDDGAQWDDREWDDEVLCAIDKCLSERHLKRLIAIWFERENDDSGDPDIVVWGDGTVATVVDFRLHELDTHFYRASGYGWLEKHMFPDIVGEVSFERDLQDWVVRGEAVITFGLDLKDPEASESEIIGALYFLPIYYRSNVVRS